MVRALRRNRRAVGSIPTRGPCAAFFAAVPGQVLKCIYILTWITNPKNSIQIFIPGQPGEPVAKMDCFGWYVLGQLAARNCRIQSVDVGTISVIEDLNILLQQDLIGVKPTELCTCSDSELRENKLVKSLSKSTTLVDGRVQIKMPWKEYGPPRRSNYNIALKRMHSTDRSFERKDCTEAVNEEVQKLVSKDL